MMVNHRFKVRLEVTFEDGGKRDLEIPDKTYYYAQQKHSYWAIWLEELLIKYDIKVKPVEIREVYEIVEVEPFNVVIGV